MKQNIGKYLTTSERMWSKVLEMLSGSDTRRMKEATEELRAHLLVKGKGIKGIGLPDKNLKGVRLLKGF